MSLLSNAEAQACMMHPLLEQSRDMKMQECQHALLLLKFNCPVIKAYSVKCAHGRSLRLPKYDRA